MLIANFKQISKKDVDLAGGKGASLGEMTRAGMPVPPGFVVLAESFEKFLDETEIFGDIEAVLKKVNHKDLNSVNKASAEIQNIILSESMPEDIEKQIQDGYRKLGGAPTLVAVRSSATAEDSKVASWAGELETYLNVTDKNLIASVEKCWASLFTPRAIFYRFEKKLHKQKISVAVVVQKMVQSEVSGICFTVHPVTKDKNQMVIEAGFGLGEAIVGGMITPDTYVVRRNDFTLADVNISEQKFLITRSPKGNINQKLPKKQGGSQKLANPKIRDLAKICLKIEKHYGRPQDIEWALEKGKFYILQSRPITTL